MLTLTVAFCTFKRADRLDKLVSALRAQSCPVPFEILAVNNNSPDNTLAVLAKLQKQSGSPLRVVTEMAPGIVPARNRALSETNDRDMIVFIDDDELPHPGLLAAAWDAIAHEGAQCAGGRIEIDFAPCGRPAWLDDEVAGFLGRLDHGAFPLWVTNDKTPVWCGNIAYSMQLFRDHPDLRFDLRYNREGASASDSGGGEDVIMLRRLLELGARIRYRPDMVVDHGVEHWKLNRRYFLRLHHLAGVRKGLYELPDYSRKLLGVPPFLFKQALRHILKALLMTGLCRAGALRQAMNATHAIGLIFGILRRKQWL